MLFLITGPPNGPVFFAGWHLEISVVTPPRWLATTEPTPPSRCLTVCSAVFLGAVSFKLSLTFLHRYLIPVWTWTHGEISGRRYRPPTPHVRFPTRMRSLGAVLSETVMTVSPSAPSTVACSEQLAHSRTTNCDIHLFPINNPSLDTDWYLPPPPRWHVKKHRHQPSCKFLPP